MGSISFESLREAPVYLEASGEVRCGESFQWKGKDYYAEQYEFCLSFLMRKGLPVDVSQFREKDLMDVIEEMDASDRQTITRNELAEVAHPNNHIAMIKDAILRDTTRALRRLRSKS